MLKRVLAIFCLCAMVCAMCACRESPESGLSPVNSALQNTDGPVADRTVALGGCLLTIPEGYAVHIDGGVVITHPDYHWQMICVVKDRSYDAGRSDPALITKGVEEAGYPITKPVDFITLDGREYEYFTYIDGQDNMLLVNTEAPGDKTMAGLAARYGSQSEEDALRDMHAIFSSLTVTDAPDSTEEDLIGRGLIITDHMEALGADAVKTAAVTYELEDFSLTMAVPDDFYWIKRNDEAKAASKTFKTADGSVEASAYIIENFAYAQLSDYVRDAIKPADDYKNVTLSDMNTETVDGKTVYYQTLSYDYYWDYKDEQVSYHKLVAASDPADGYYLQVTAEQQGAENTLCFETVRAFFEKSDPANVNTLATGESGAPEERRYIASEQEAQQALRLDGEKNRRENGSPDLAGLEKRMEEAYGLYAVNLGDMPLSVAEKVEEAFAGMYETYPQLKGAVTNLSVGKVQGGAVALTAYNTFIQNTGSLYPAVYKLEIQLNEAVFSNETRLYNMIENAVKEGHWMPDTNIQALVAHELGHALLARIAMDAYGFETPYYVTEDNAEAFSQYVIDGLSANQYTASQIIRDAHQAYCAAHPDQALDEEGFRALISGYAVGEQKDGGVSYGETFAEAVADAYLHGENMCEASALILKAAGL